jgi:hypothetical protein
MELKFQAMRDTTRLTCVKTEEESWASQLVSFGPMSAGRLIESLWQCSLMSLRRKSLRKASTGRFLSGTAIAIILHTS